MKVLVVGSGGREHAICWKLRQSPHLSELYCAPGNPGIGEIADRVPIAVDEIQNLADFAAEMKVDLTVIGPELPLTLGIVDQFQERGLAVFGPNRDAAILEGSKVFAKEFMRRHAIPTADFEVVQDLEEARDAINNIGLPLVMKADGLAAGKGVLIVRNDAEAQQALKVFFEDRQFGQAGDRVVVEECLQGEEVSFIVLSDGKRLLTFASSKDYKRIGEDDTGLNTGGMGAHSPSVVLSKEDAARVLDQVMRVTVEGMASEGRPFSGVLYAGLMLTADGPRVLEYNVRMGDPEAQPLLVRLEDDLLPVLASGAAGHFDSQRLQFRPEATACIVLASAGYPGTPAKGDSITGIDAATAFDGVEVFHAGTKLENGRLTASGGRVLNVCGSGPTLQEALKRAYQGASEIHWTNKIFRSDIGRRVLPRQMGSG